MRASRPVSGGDGGNLGRSELLRMRLLLAADEYHDASSALWSHPRLRTLFPDYLYRIHSIIRASVPVMEAARDRAAALAADDPACAALHAYLAQHVPEERHHDDWLLDDLEVLGVSRASVFARQPSPTVASLVGAQYYWINHHHPVAVMGYIAVLEGTPPDEEHILGVMRATGLPPDAFRTFIKHARLDPHHRDDLNDALDAMPLTEDQEALVTVNALETQHGLAKSLRETIAAAAAKVVAFLLVATLALPAIAVPARAQTAVTSSDSLPTVQLPAELDRVLRDYERLWKAGDAAALVMLFTEDGFVMQPGKPPVRGREAMKRVYTGQGGGALKLRALAYATSDTVGYIIGAYGYGDAPGDMGKFTLTLRRQRGGKWLIASDMDNGSRAPTRPPVRDRRMPAL